MPADALHRVHARTRRPRCAIRAAAARASPIDAGDDARCRSARARSAADVAADAPRRDPRVRQRCCSRRSPRRRSSTRPSPTCASSSRSTSSSSLELAREHDALVTVEENVVAGGAGSAVAEALAAAGDRRADPASRLARRVHRSRRPGVPARAGRARRARASRRRSTRASATRAGAEPRRQAGGLRSQGRCLATIDAAMNRPEQPGRLMPIPDVQSGTRRAPARDRPGRHQGPALSVAVRRPRRRRAADDRDVQRVRRAARGSQGHAHVAPGRAARGARGAGRGAADGGACARCSTTSSCGSMRPAGASSSRSRTSCARRRRCRAWRACSTTR